MLVSALKHRCLSVFDIYIYIYILSGECLTPGANHLIAERAPWRFSQSCATGGQQPIGNPYRFVSHFFCTPGNPFATPTVTRGEGSLSYQGVSTRQNIFKGAGLALKSRFCPLKFRFWRLKCRFCLKKMKQKRRKMIKFSRKGSPSCGEESTLWTNASHD